MNVQNAILLYGDPGIAFLMAGAWIAQIDKHLMDDSETLIPLDEPKPGKPHQGDDHEVLG